jgi:plasmid stabilization system protein ParE
VGGAPGIGSRNGSAEALAEVVYSARAVENLARAIQFLSSQSPEAAVAAAAAIRSAVEALAAHPLLGRRVEGELRELVISYGATGYIALYRFVVLSNQVRVLAIRHQRELGYLP